MSKKTLRLLTLLSIIALIAIGISVALTQHYYELRNGAAGFKSYCNISEKVNCDIVAASPYAEFVGGIPLSSFAAGWFLALFILTLVARVSSWKTETLRAMFAMQIFGAVFSLAYLFIMMSIIKTLCLLCLLTDLATLSSLGILYSMRTSHFKDKKYDWNRWKTFAGVTAVSLLIAVTFLKAFDNLSSDTQVIDETADSVLNGSVNAIKIPDTAPSIGPKDAPITIAEFSDFQCPFCRIGALIVNSVFERYPGKIRIVFKNFPLNSECNRTVERSMHPVACEAAYTALCANAQGKFEPYYKEMFEKQATLAPGLPHEFAKNAGVDESKLSQCVSSSSTELLVAADVEEGSQLGIKSTPTFFINGRKLEGAFPLPVWTRIIDRLLKP